MIKGRCECGRVNYEIDGKVKDFSHCHCSQCRRMHGAAYATFAGVAKDHFRYVGDQTSLKHYFSSASHDRVFCGECGSNILVGLDTEPNDYYVSMGSMDGDLDLPPGYHIFTGSKASWHTINDDLPQHDEFPPE